MRKIHRLTSVITGDIINSRKARTPGEWLRPLKKVLREAGPTPLVWDIYRGDSFQVEIKRPEDALAIAIRIKATIKCFNPLDVRMAIGIGEKAAGSRIITESTGDAFVFSGELLEKIKSSGQNLAVKSASTVFDEEINLYLRLLLIAMNNWKKGSAEAINMVMSNPSLTQKALSKKLSISQPSVSARLQRAYLAEINDVIQIYRNKVSRFK